MSCDHLSLFYSNGFLNPAVTIGVALAGVLNPITALCYILMQIVGAVTGAAIASVSTCLHFRDTWLCVNDCKTSVISLKPEIHLEGQSNLSLMLRVARRIF